MRNKSGVFLLSSLVYATGVLLFIGANNQPANADTTHIVISQIQLSGASTNDEFVELYNPTGATVDLGKWRLTRKSSTGGSVQNLVASLSGTIAPKHYFLISHPSASSSISADALYSSSSSAMTTNNTVTLFSDAGLTVVDKVGLGTAVDMETAAFSDNPEGGESIVRKATVNSTSETLFTGGIETMLGNGWDTDNNASDFVLFTTSLPRNSASQVAQPTVTGTPSNTPAPSLTIAPTVQPTATTAPTQTPVVPTNTPSPTPTNIPTATSTPATVPTVKPTSTPTPTNMPANTPVPTTTPKPTTTTTPLPTITPTNIPTAIPTAILTPVPTTTPTPNPGGQVIVNQVLSKKMKLVCVQTQRQYTVLGYKFLIPQVKCTIIRI